MCSEQIINFRSLCMSVCTSFASCVRSPFTTAHPIPFSVCSPFTHRALCVRSPFTYRALCVHPPFVRVCSPLTSRSCGKVFQERFRDCMHSDAYLLATEPLYGISMHNHYLLNMFLLNIWNLFCLLTVFFSEFYLKFIHKQ